MNNLIGNFQNMEFKKLKNLTEIISSKKIKKTDYLKKGKIPIIDQSNKFISGYSNEEGFCIEKEVIVFGDHTCVLKYIDFPFIQGADGIKIIKIKNNKLLAKFVYYFLKSNVFYDGKYTRHWSQIKEIKIPIPSLKEQEKIVDILDKFIEITTELTTELTLTLQQYEYYKNDLFYKGENIKFIKLGDLTKIKRGERITKKDLVENGKFSAISGGTKPFGKINYKNKKCKPNYNCSVWKRRLYWLTIWRFLCKWCLLYIWEWFKNIKFKILILLFKIKTKTYKFIS